MSKQHQSRTLSVLACVLTLFLLGACSDDTEVGEGVESGGDGGSGNLSIGDDTTTTSEAPVTTVTAAPTTTAKAAPVTTTAAPPTTRPPATTQPPTTQPQAETYKITINGDNSGDSQFSPNRAAVSAGTVVEFVNADAVERSVVAQSGAFRSPMIPAGGSWKYKASTPGDYSYQDGTRPYAVGSLQVQ